MTSGYSGLGPPNFFNDVPSAAEDLVSLNEGYYEQTDSYSADTSAPVGASSFESTSQAAFEGWASLTPEALMIYCQSQLKSLDADIKGFMDNQKTMNVKKKVYQELKKSLDANNLINKDGEVFSNRAKATLDAFQKAYNELKGMGLDVEAEQLNAHMQQYFPASDLETGVHSTSGCSDFDKDSIHSSLILPMENTIDELTKNAEMNMLQLQSLMSQRQTAIQMTQSIMDKQLKTLEQLASKVGG